MELLKIQGRFEDLAGSGIAGAAVHADFLGDPPRSWGTDFDLIRAPTHTNDAGEFELTLGHLDTMLSQIGGPGVWKHGYFLVLAAKNAHTIGFAIHNVPQFSATNVRLVALACINVSGTVLNEIGQPIAGVQVRSGRFFLSVGFVSNPPIQVNFNL